MNIGTLITKPLQDLNGFEGIPKDYGQYDLNVTVPDRMFLEMSDKKEFIKRTVAAHLASVVMDTEVPEHYWRLIVDKKMQKIMDWPELINFEMKK